MMHWVDFFGRQERRRVVVRSILHMSPVVWFCPGVWSMLRVFGRRMLEFVKGCLKIFGHGDVACACGIVPVNGESAEEETGPVNGDGV